MQLLLNALQMPQSVIQEGTMSPEISPQEHHTEWKTQNEGTASAHDSLGFKDHESAIHDKNVAAVDCLLRVIPCKTGFCPKGYRNAVDYQILKKPEFLQLKR